MRHAKSSHNMMLCGPTQEVAADAPVSEKYSHLRDALISRFYDEGRAAGLSDAALDQLLAEIRAAGRLERARRLTPVGVDRRIVRKTLEAFDLVPAVSL
jgi:hypothetical protein